MNFVRFYGFAGVLVMGWLIYGVMVGRVPNQTRTDTLDPSVRENPSSYRPVYVGNYGPRVYVPSSSGSGGSSGGYSGGK